MKEKTIWKPMAILLAVILCFSFHFALPVSADYENTHVNTGNQATDLVEVARTQVGYHEGTNNYTKYNVWFGSLNDYGYNYAWCQTFVAWCANQAGIPTSMIPRVSGTVSGMDFFKKNETWKDAGITPEKGDIIYLHSKSSSGYHVGIVADVSGGQISTIEGNSSDRVAERSYSVGNSSIVGYGCPEYVRPNPDPPTNLSIQSDKTTIAAGESISFSYTIENSNDSYIGIDKDGTRYASIPVSGTSGEVSYTFTEPGSYCVIVEGSNPYGYKFCDKGIWILVNEAAPPTNLSIQSDKTTIAAGESISFSYTIENSNDSYIGIDKDGTRYASIPVSGTSGEVSYTFTEPGSYCVIVEGSNPYGYKFCDKGIWILVNEAAPPTNLSIQSDKTTIAAGESISFSYTIENSNDSYIGIDKDGTRYASIPVSGTSGEVSYTFTEPGSYCVIIEGSNPYGYKFCDKGIWISVKYTPGDLNQDGTLSLTDLIPLQQSLLRQTTLTADEAQLADYNGDGNINVLDLMLLKRALLS